jgi:uncharacterized protein YjeT (DUF2065 family)
MITEVINTDQHTSISYTQQTLRLAGLAAACAGVVLVWLVRR